MMRFLLIAIALLASPIVPAQGDPYNDGYKRGYKDGFSEGYQKAQDDARGAPVSGPPPQPAPAGGPISIQMARYGSTARGCDVTHYVRRRAQGRYSAAIDVTNSMCGDPDPGQRNLLEVSYMYGGIAKSDSAYEHRTVFLNCNE